MEVGIVRAVVVDTITKEEVVQIEGPSYLVSKWLVPVRFQIEALDLLIKFME